MPRRAAKFQFTNKLKNIAKGQRIRRKRNKISLLCRRAWRCGVGVCAPALCRVKLQHSVNGFLICVSIHTAIVVSHVVNPARARSLLRKFIQRAARGLA